MDRWSKERRRRELLVATLHAEVREEHLVEDQSRKGDPAHRAGANERGRDPRGRASQTRWSLGWGVRFREWRHDTSGFSGRTQQKPKAKAFFATLDSRNRYAVLFRIQTAKKAETRTKRIKQFTEMLSQHKKIYP